MWRIIAGYGAIGGGCMPLMTASQNLVRDGLPNEIPARFLVGWVLGVVIVAVVGAIVALILGHHHSEKLNAFVIGLTLPAILTALSHRTPDNRALFYRTAISLITSSFAGETIRDRALSISPSVHSCCNSIFFEHGNSLSIETLNPTVKSIDIPNDTTRAWLSTPSGLTETPLPSEPGSYKLSIEKRSDFKRGVDSALGIHDKEYDVLNHLQRSETRRPEWNDCVGPVAERAKSACVLANR
jgi:hypothetical protein